MPTPTFIFPSAPALSASAIYALDVFADKPVFQPESASFTRATTATRTNSSGLIETVSAGIARVDWSGSGAPNTLLEPQRTNLLTYSEDFTNASWAKNDTTLSENSTISPDGTLDASTISLSNSNSSLRKAVVLGSGTYTFSFYVKKLSTTSGATMRLFSVVDTLSVSLNFTPTEQWVRYSYTFTAVTSVTQVQLRAQSLIGNVAIWGAQLELGAYATSYIPTTSTSVTRNTDAFNLSNVYTSGKITSAGGTWFVDIRNNISYTRDAIARLGLGSDSTFTNGLILTNDATSRVIISKRLSGVTTTLHPTTTDTAKIAIKWNGTTADVFVNGVKVVTATSFAFTVLEFLTTATTNGTPYFVNSSALYQTPLLDYQCEMLTGLKFDTYNEMAGYYNYTIQ
jgi:hypothetical protein